MAVQDRDIAKMISQLRDISGEMESEVENLEGQIEEKDDEIKQLTETNGKLESEVEELQARVTELEEALAEAYLTSEADNVDKENSVGG